MLDHEKLDVYRCSIDFLRIALRLAGRLPRGQGALVDQLRRAATAIPLNIAEGAGKTTDPDRARFHAIARGSAMECGALLDVLRLLAATNKSGRLQVQGVSRAGTVWVDSGKVLAAESPNTPHERDMADVVFQLLRIDRGSFRFELDRAPAQPGDPVEIETALNDAEGMLGEWRELEHVVPSVEEGQSVVAGEQIGNTLAG